MDICAYLHHIEAVERNEILGCPVDAVNLAETVDRARHAIDSGETVTQVSINALKIALAHDDPAFAAALRSFDLAGADGQPVVWAAKLLGRPIPGRVNGTDLMFELFALAEREGYGVYLLGAKQEALDAATAELRRRFPRLRLAGARHGYFAAGEEPQVIREVADANPDILFVALPSPRKELFLVEHAAELGAGFAMGVGGSIDVLGGVAGWTMREDLRLLARKLGAVAYGRGAYEQPARVAH